MPNPLYDDDGASLKNAPNGYAGLDAGGLVLVANLPPYAGTGTSATNASITLNTAGLAISVGAPAAGVGIAAGTRTATTAGNLLFNTGNGITFGLDAVGGSIMTASHNAITTGRASNDAVGLNTALTANGVAWTVNSAGISLNVPAFLTTARGSTDAIGLNTAQTNVTWTANSAGLSFNAGGYAGTATGFTGANISGTFTHNTVGLSMSLSVAAPGGGAAISGNTISQNTGTVNFSASNGVTFGLNTNGVMTASVAAGAAGPAASYFMWPAGAWQGTTNFNVSGSTSWVQPIMIPYDVSVSYVRLPVTFSCVGSMASIATAANVTRGMTVSSTINIAFYSQNVGASSRSLASYATGSASWIQQARYSAGAQGSQWTSGHTISYPFEGGNTNLTTTQATSLTNVTFQSSQLSNFTGIRFLDIPFATSLAAGAYWFMYGSSSSISTSGTANISTVRFTAGNIALTQVPNAAHNLLGVATNSSNQFNQGLGSWTTNVIGTTASVALSGISTSASHPFLPFQMIRQV